LCSATLAPTGRAYPLDELLAGWHPAIFSRETLDDLRNQADHTRLYECAACGFGIFHPRIIGNSSFYREIGGVYSGEYYQDWKWEFGEAIADTKSCRSILDVGCGAGGFLEKAKAQVPDVAGVDFNESALSVARGKGIRTFRSLDSIPSPGNRFDAVFTFHVLEHVPDPVDFLHRLAGFLAPSGKVGLSVPNMDGPVRFIDPCYMNMPPHHATRWTSKALQSLAGRIGLAVERTVVEPLSYRDRDYYTTHWVNRVSSGNPVLRKLLRWGSKNYFRALFGLLSATGRNVTTLHSGQSVYVLMRRK
jgi:2-polyprenyl-3-methyl-5-hydroxy-6-metoxy-1,4-benzoquinol methylase